MTSYVALLRGINVGTKTQIDMKELKALFESAGFSQVRTYINSGNVLFESDLDPKTILQQAEAVIETRYGSRIPVLLRDAQTIAALCQAFPSEWTNDDIQRTDILFLSPEFDSASSIKLIRHDPSVDTLIYAHGSIAWHLDRVNVPKSGMKRFIGTPLYKAMTARNINTLRKLNSLLNPE